MRSRPFAAVGILLAIGSVLLAAGCSQGTPPPPTVDNTKVEPPKSVETTLGVETTITVSQLIDRLEKQGLDVVDSPTKQNGLFLPAKYHPIVVDGAFVQTYRFTNAREAKGAARTVDAGGFILGATPDQLINVNWTGWPAFFRNGDLIVIFVTEKGKKPHTARDKKIFEALKGILGSPFVGGQTAAPGAPIGGHGGSAVSSATTTGSAASKATTQ